MTLSIFFFFFTGLFFFVLEIFEIFVIFKLRKIDSQTNSISKNYWSMGIYMNDIPQNEQNTLYLSSVPLKLYNCSEYSDFPIPRVGEEISGVYHSGEIKFWINGIVKSVSYNTDTNLIIIECKCIDIHKI